MYISRVLSRFRYLNVINLRQLSSQTQKHIELSKNTLTGRLLLHIDKWNQELNFENSQSWCLKPLNILTNYKELVQLESQEEKLEKLKLLDSIYSDKIKDFESSTIFNVLYIYMLITPNYITKYKFYKKAVDHLNDYLEYLSTAEVLQLMFYIALQKKNNNSKLYLKNCLKRFNPEDISNLSIVDLCIICNSTFKSATKISNQFILNKVIETISNNLFLLKDPAIFLTLIKTLRHNRAQNENILTTISSTILFNSTYQFYNFGAICHILAAYADYLYYDEPILKLFSEKCVQLLKESKPMPKTTYITDCIRVKDIKRFLWGFSNIGYKFEKKVFAEIIVPKLLERAENGEFQNDLESLFDSIFYMWMLRYQAVELVPYLNTKNIKIINESKSQSKFRLNILLTCIQLENLPLYKKLGVKAQSFQNFDIKQQVGLRPDLERIYNVLKEVKNKTEVNKFEYECQIPHLKVVGITGYKKNIYKSVFIEVLDDYVCVKNKTDFAAGLMQLKLRLLDSMEQALIIISSEDMKIMTNKELEEHLKSEINMVC